MKAIYGITNHSIMLVAQYLQNLKVKLYVVSDRIKYANVLLFPSISLLKANYRIIKDWPCIAYVFDGPVACYTYNLQLLDVEKVLPGLQFIYKPLTQEDIYQSIKSAKGKAHLVKRNINYIDEMFNSCHYGFLNPILTYLYKVNSEKREEYKRRIFDWFLGKRLVLPNTKSSQQLIQFLKSEKGRRARKAVKYIIKHKNINYAKRKWNIDPFDLRYTYLYFKRREK